MADPISIAAAEEAFSQAVADQGFGVHDIAADGAWHSFAFPDNSRGRKSGAAKLTVVDGKPDGVVIDRRQGNSPILVWRPDKPVAVDNAYRERMEAAARERKRKREEVRLESLNLFYTLPSATADHAYLTRKKITDPCPVRLDGDDLVVPIFTAATGEFQTIQRITPDGGKFFPKDATYTGGCAMPHCSRQLDDLTRIDHRSEITIVIAEGYATAAAIRSATSLPTLAALSCGNLRAVAEAMRERLPMNPIVIAADDETKKEEGRTDHPGIDCALAAARAVGNCKVAIPSRGDFNDVYVHDGPERVAEEIGAATEPPPAAARSTDDGLGPIFARFAGPRTAPAPPPPKRSLDEVHDVFRKWFGDEYDMDALDVTLAAAASEKLTGDPLWLLVISGPGAAKTETVQALVGAGAHVTSTIASEGALLSATPARSRRRTATGGLLRKIGDRGVLVIKDVTSILSADRNVRTPVLAAIREIYDGRWERNVGTDGGQTLTWVGRIVIVGAVTTAWDAHHAVVAIMGDRFVLVRIDSTDGRVESGLRAIRNTGNEVTMRKELADAAGGLIAHACTDDVTLTDDEVVKLVNAANIVTMVRTGVERDYRGEVIDSHAPEMPTRFAKQLAQVVRGAVAVGMTRGEGMRLAIRCARDSMPPLRLAILLDVDAYPASRPADVRKRVGKPWTSVKREMEALTMLGVLECDEERVTEGGDAGPADDPAQTGSRPTTPDGLDRVALSAMAGVDLDAI